MNAPSNLNTGRRIIGRWLFPLSIWIWVFISWIRHDFGITEFVFGALSLFWLGAAWLIHNHTTRPRQTFYWVALASSAVAALFVGFAGAGRETILPGIVGWAGLTALGLIWCIHFERTETIL